LEGYGSLTEGKKMKTLILGKDFETEMFEEHFEEVEEKSLADTMITMNGGSEVLINGEDIETWDAVYIQPESKAVQFSRVLMETLSLKEIHCNLNTSVFIPVKKPYLLQVLSEKEVKTPVQTSISTEKGLTEIEKEVEFPVVTKKYRNLDLEETKIFDNFENLKKFCENTEHGESFVVIQEYSEEDVFDILYIDGDIISLKLEDNPWSSEEVVTGKYHSLSDKQKEVVKDAVSAIGLKICSLRLNGTEVMDVKNDPQLERFREESGKNVYGRVASMLEGDQD